MRAARLGLVLVVVAAALSTIGAAGAAPPATFTGRLIDGTAAGVVGTVTPWYLDESTSTAVYLPAQSTAPDGTFSVTVPDGGHWNLVATAPGFVTRAVGADSLPVDDGATFPVGEVVMDPGATVTGTVTDTVGAGLAGVAVTSDSDLGHVEVRTEADGTYVLGVPEGQQRITFEKPGFAQDCYPALAPDDPTIQPCASITVGLGEVVSADVSLFRAGRISGSFTDPSGSHAGEIRLYDAVTHQEVRGTATGAQDTYAVGGLRPGAYLLQATSHSEGAAPELYADAYGTTSASVLSVAEGAVLTGIDIDIEEGGTISGRVTDSAGNPAANRQIAARPAGDPGAAATALVRRTVTDDEGQYVVTGLGATSYVVSAAAGGGSPTYHPASPDLAGATPVAAMLGGSVTGIDIQVPNPASGTVALRRTDGTTITAAFSGATLCPVPSVLAGFSCSGGAPSGGGGLVSSSTGVVTLPSVNAGAYNLSALVNGAPAGAPHPLTVASGDTFECTLVVDGPGSTCTVTPGGGPVADDDGVPDVVEDAAPNGGDGNGDGVADRLQPNVSSLPAASGGGYVTIAAPTGVAVSSVTVTPIPAEPALPPGATVDAGVIAYTLDEVGPGVVDVELTLSAGVTATTYLKLQGDAWVALPPSAFTIAGDTITLHLVDGGIGDEDGQANGTIVDPGTPANLDVAAPTITCPATPSVLFKAAGATLTATVSDGRSGVASPTATVPLATGVAGLRSVSVSATDLAGNVGTVACPYRVVYDVQWIVPFGGPGPRSALRDTVVPLTFRLADAQGRAVPGAVVSAPTSTAVGCPSGAMPLVASLPMAATTSSLGGGIWLAGWKANKAWKGTCRLVAVPLADGTAPTMVIKVV